MEGEWHGRIAGILLFIMIDIKQLDWRFVVIVTGGTILSLYVLNFFVLLCKPFFRSIPPKGKHLDTLTWIDFVYLWFNRFCTPLFTYHVAYYCYHSQFVEWNPSALTFSNTIIATILLFIVYDFFYTIYHRSLHIRGIYKFIHKHHHRQMVPTRGNTDAINVHPIEFVMGEYNHLFTIYLLSFILPSIHVYTVLGFLIIAAALASFNHTRFDIRLWKIYQVKYHDIHHYYPSVNFGQYTMFWDHAFGWFNDNPSKAHSQ